MSGRAIVAALGHAWLRDESFGLQVLAALGRRTVPPHVDVADWSFGTITAFQRLTEGGYDSAVFVASAARGRAPGILYRHTADDPLPPTDEIHARICDCAMGLVSLDNLLIMARFYRVLPRRVTVIEAEPVDDTWGDDLSPTVAALVPQAVAQILDEVTGGAGA